MSDQIIGYYITREAKLLKDFDKEIESNLRPPGKA